MIKATVINATTADDIVSDYVDSLDEIVQVFADFIEQVFGTDSKTAMAMADSAFAEGRVDYYTA